MAEETVLDVIDTMDDKQKAAMYNLIYVLLGSEEDEAEDSLAHHGVKGMKWGVRHDEKSSGGGKRGSWENESISESRAAKGKKLARKALTIAATVGLAMAAKKFVVDNATVQAVMKLGLNPNTLGPISKAGAMLQLMPRASDGVVDRIVKTALGMGNY